VRFCLLFLLRFAARFLELMFLFALVSFL